MTTSSSPVRFLFLISAATLFALPASATTFRVEWQGVATHHYTWNDPVESISIPVSGLFEMDLDLLALDPNPNPDLEPGDTSWGGGYPPLKAWSIQFEASATSDLIQDLSEYRGWCDAWCDSSSFSGLTASFLFDGSDDPYFGQLDIGPDGTGTWATGLDGGNGHEVHGLVNSSVVSIVPEPSSALLTGLGLFGLGNMRRRP
jgi:hypothetical protein